MPRSRTFARAANSLGGGNRRVSFRSASIVLSVELAIVSPAPRFPIPRDLFGRPIIAAAREAEFGLDTADARKNTSGATTVDPRPNPRRIEAWRWPPRQPP